MARPRHWSYYGEKRRPRILRRDLYECQIKLPGCLVTADQVDHIIPKDWEGSEQESNLRAACRKCNNALNNPKTRAAFESGISRSLSVGANSTAPLLNPSPRNRWLTVPNDYSRREASDGDSSG